MRERGKEEERGREGEGGREGVGGRERHGERHREGREGEKRKGGSLVLPYLDTIMPCCHVAMLHLQIITTKQPLVYGTQW